MKTSKLIITLFALILTLVFVNSAHAGDSKNLRKAKKDLKSISSAQKKLKVHYSSLTPEEQGKLLDAQTSDLVDSDSDGISNVIEDVSTDHDSCNSDSDGDGHSDGGERENKGLITAATSSSFTVKSTTWQIDGSTHYEDGSVGDLIVGACVEVKGITSGANFLATKVEFKEAGDCSSGHH